MAARWWPRATKMGTAAVNLCPARASYPQEGTIMADRAGLNFVGLIFGGVTAAVMLVAVTVVIGHIDGRLVLDGPPAQISASQ
jgi:hypothetical protein